MKEPLTLSDDEPLSLRERRRRDTELAIRDAALHLFVHQGSQDTTVDDIAARAGVSTRTFFRYFDTKESAVLPTVDWVHGRFNELSVSVCGLEDVAATLDLIFIDALTDMHDAESGRSRLFFRLLGTDAVIRDAAITRDAQTERWLVQRLTELLPTADGLELRLLVSAGVARSRTVWSYWYELDQDPDSPPLSVSQLFTRAREILSGRSH